MTIRYMNDWQTYFRTTFTICFFFPSFTDEIKCPEFKKGCLVVNLLMTSQNIAVCIAKFGLEPVLFKTSYKRQSCIFCIKPFPQTISCKTVMYTH